MLQYMHIFVKNILICNIVPQVTVIPKDVMFKTWKFVWSLVSSPFHQLLPNQKLEISYGWVLCETR